MNKKSVMIIVMALFLNSLLVYSQPQSETKTPQQKFKADSSSENFNGLANPTADDLRKVSNPTLANFQLLNQRQQRDYLTTDYRTDFAADFIARSDFASANDLMIAGTYFSESGANINSNKNAFERYYHQKTGRQLSLEGDMESYEAPGFKTKGIRGTQFNNPQDIPQGWKITVMTDGSVSICRSTAPDVDCEGSRIELAGGDIEYDPQYDAFSICDGWVNGNQIEEGSDLKFDSHGNIVSGKAKSFETPNARVVFAAQQDFSYNPQNNILGVIGSYGEIVELEGDIMIEGLDILIPQGQLMEGTITYTDGVPSKVGADSEALIDGFVHTTTNNDLRLLSIDTPELRQLIQEEEDKMEPFIGTHGQLQNELNDITVKLDAVNKKIDGLHEQIEDAREAGDAEAIEKLNKEIDENNNIARELYDERHKISNQFVPVELKIDEISRSYDEKKSQLYQKAMQNMDTTGNVFITGDDRVWVGGDGFRTQMTESNEIFPEFQDEINQGTYNPKTSRFIVEPKGGQVYIERGSARGNTLALNLRAEGSYRLYNGNWEIVSDGRDILGDVDNAGDYLAVDMRLAHETPSGDWRLYDMDVDSKYIMPLPQEEKDAIQVQIDSEDQELQRLQSEIQAMFESNEELRNLDSQLADLNQKIRENGEEYNRINHRITVTTRETTDPENREAILDKLREEKVKVNEEFAELQTKKDAVLQDPLYKDVQQRRDEMLGHEQNRISLEASLERGVVQKGVFGEVKVSDSQMIRSGDFTIDRGGFTGSYETYIQGFPVLKNTYVKVYMAGVATEHVVTGGETLDVPGVASIDTDILDLDVLKNQQCLHTQYRLRFEYLKESGRNPEDITFTIDNGGHALDVNLEKWRNGEYRDVRSKDGNPLQGKDTSDDRYISTVMGYMGGVKVHTTKYPEGEGFIINQQTPVVDKQFVEITDYDDIKPGDVLIGGDGHGMAVKEIIESPPGSGERYVRIFAGYQPESDAEVYYDLLPLGRLERNYGLPHAYPLTGVLRWTN